MGIEKKTLEAFVADLQALAEKHGVAIVGASYDHEILFGPSMSSHEYTLVASCGDLVLDYTPVAWREA